jgi:hypothetical protein
MADKTPNQSADRPATGQRSADEQASDGDTVLVSPAGVHTPGRTAMGGEAPYVEAPADAASNPEAARAAYEKAQRGEHDATLPAGVIPQNADGSAMTRDQADQAVRDEREQADYVQGKTDKAPDPKR